MTHPIAFDLETHRFCIGNMAPRVVCLTWADEWDCGILTGHDNIETWLQEKLDMALAGRAKLIGCNVAYDATCILAHFPSVWAKVWRAYEQGAFTCIELRERLLDIAAGEFNFPLLEGKKFKTKYSMKDIAKVRLGIDISKGSDTWRLRYAELDGIPHEQWPKDAVEYAIGDAMVTWKIYRQQEQRKAHLRYSMDTEQTEVRAQLALHLMAVRGVKIDTVWANEQWNKYVDLMEGLAEDVVAYGLAKWTGKTQNWIGRKPVPEIKQDLAATRAAVEKHYPGKIPRTNATKKYPRGQIKTGGDVIELCEYKPLRQLTEFKKYQKICNTYLSKMFAPIVHARFWAVGAESDRTSCSNPNLQNLPRQVGVRECIVAREDTVFVFTDVDSQEMRTLGQSCMDILGHSKLAAKYRADRHFDPHLDFARTIAGDRAEEFREQTKVANFGFPGGMAAKTFVSYAGKWGLDIPLQRSERLRNTWFTQWPEMNEYFEHIRKLIGPADYATQINPRTGFRRGAVGYKDAANGYFQHLAAVASKHALWEVTKRAYNVRNSYLYGSRPVLFIHDEIGMEAPQEAAHEAAIEMETVMVEAMEELTPDVPSAASAILMRRWTKEAQRVTKDGRLIPWENQ